MAKKERNVEVRQQKRDLPVPWKPNDRGLAKVLKTINDEAGIVAKMAEEAKPHREALKEAYEMLAKGRKVPVECEMRYDYNAQRVIITRLDTKEVVEDREMTDKDRELNLFGRKPK